jgi:hypothetical protein
MAYTPTDELAHFEGARADARSTYQNLLGERDEKLNTARTTHGPGSDRWNRAEEKLRTAEKKSPRHLRKAAETVRRSTDIVLVVCFRSLAPRRIGGANKQVHAR